MENNFVTRKKEETWEVARQLLHKLSNLGSNVIALEGELGAGKTTFAQGFLQTAGAEGPFTSPTFVIMKKYDLKGDEQRAGDYQTVYHLDCYRVGSQDVIDLGWNEIISDPHNIVLVEWPERIKDILPDRHIHLNFEIVDDEKRKITIDKSDTGK